MTITTNLHRQFLDLARQKRKAEYQLLALLPAIYQSGIYKKYARTIEGYSYRYAGLSEGVVRKRLNLERHLVGKPSLKAAIAEVGIHKVALLATIATPETEELLAEKLKTLSKPATQQLSKELRGHNAPQTITITLSVETSKLLNQLKKRESQPLTTDQIIQKLLLNELHRSQSPKPQTQANNTDSKSSPRKILSRHIPLEQKRQTYQTFGHTCAYPTCHQPAKVIHHVRRYAQHKSHNHIIPLCHIHHEFAHHNLIKNEMDAPHNWQLQLKPTENIYDKSYIHHKQKLRM